MMVAAAEAGAINLDLPMGRFLDAIASTVPNDPSGELALHILCCNEYALVTGLTAGPLDETRLHAADIKNSLE
jgi:hypothetical protein